MNPLRQKAHEIIANLYGWNCKLISVVDQEADYTLITEALETLRRETIEACARVADEMDTIVSLDCPCGLSTSVPASRRHIAEAIRKLGEGKG